jgi:hypothetical protein
MPYRSSEQGVINQSCLADPHGDGGQSRTDDCIQAEQGIGIDDLGVIYVRQGLCSQVLK